MPRVHLVHDGSRTATGTPESRARGKLQRCRGLGRPDDLETFLRTECPIEASAVEKALCSAFFTGPTAPRRSGASSPHVSAAASRELVSYPPLSPRVEIASSTTRTVVAVRTASECLVKCLSQVLGNQMVRRNGRRNRSVLHEGLELADSDLGAVWRRSNGDLTTLPSAALPLDDPVGRAGKCQVARAVV